MSPRIPGEVASARRQLRRIAAVAAARAFARPELPQFYLGVDPGVTGAVAVLDAAGDVVLLADIPLRRDGRRRRADYDLVAIRKLLSPWRARAVAVVEVPGPMPRISRAGLQLGGSLANHARGVAEGWAWMLVGMRWPRARWRQVAPIRWQREMLRRARGSDTGARAIAAVRRRWPRQDLRRTERCTTPHAGRVDALLLAEYGRRLSLDGRL